MPKEGILLVAFGKNFAELAKAAYTKSVLEGYPIHVVTDRPNGRIFAGLPWTVTECPNMTVQQNREVKCLMYQYTPFDRTLYLDVDQVVPRPGIHKFFELPGNLVMTPVFLWKPGCKIVRLYKHAFAQLGAKLPITVYGGALLRFDRTAETVSLFKRWRFNWNANGRGRDMPALACAVQQWKREEPGRAVTPVPQGWHAGFMRRDDKSIIQHAWSDAADFCKVYGLPNWEANCSVRPYEANAKHDWAWVDSGPHD